MLVNSSLDPARSTELLARTNGGPMVLVRMDGSETVLPASGQDGAYDRYLLPALKPWEMLLLVAE